MKTYAAVELQHTLCASYHYIGSITKAVYKLVVLGQKGALKPIRLNFHFCCLLFQQGSHLEEADF